MSRKDLHLLLERYLQNQCSAEEKLMIEKLYGMLDKNDLEEVHANELKTIEDKLWDRINHDICLDEDLPADESPMKPDRQMKRKIWFAAAAVSAAVLISGYLFSSGLKNPAYREFESAAGILEKKNTGATPMTIQLEDGSVVILQPKSSLFYPSHFSAATREVSLKGEGFFQISKNPDRPFFVYNKNVITRVVGTSFIVKTNEQTDQAEVTVKTGKVMVCLNEDNQLNLKHLFGKALFNETQTVLLTPNQKTTYLPADHKLKTSLAAEPVLVQTKEHAHEPALLPIYDEVAVNEIVLQLGKAYGIEIIILNKELGRNTFTGDLSGQNLYKQLQMVCHTINAVYEISGTKIMIKPKTGL